MGAMDLFHARFLVEGIGMPPFFPPILEKACTPVVRNNKNLSLAQNKACLKTRCRTRYTPPTGRHFPVDEIQQTCQGEPVSGVVRFFQLMLPGGTRADPHDLLL